MAIFVIGCHACSQAQTLLQQCQPPESYDWNDLLAGIGVWSNRKEIVQTMEPRPASNCLPSQQRLQSLARKKIAGRIAERADPVSIPREAIRFCRILGSAYLLRNREKTGRKCHSFAFSVLRNARINRQPQPK